MGKEYKESTNSVPSRRQRVTPECMRRHQRSRLRVSDICSALKKLQLEEKEVV